MNDLISIIVPVYKVEKEIDRCVDSLLKQTYKNIEIILVDDGSPDNCPELCDQYAKEDNRVCVIHKKNGGLSDARNSGLKAATGDYILYVDSDDYINLDSCEKFLKSTLGGKVDIIVGNAIMEKADAKELMVHTATPSGICYKSNEFIKKAIKAYQWYAPAWLNMYRREFLLENDLFYKKGIYFEDMQMLPRVFLKANSITCMDEIFYHYVIREASITTSEKNKKKEMDSFQNLKEWKQLFDSIQDIDLQKYLYGMLIKCYLHECRIYGVENWNIDGMNFRFSFKYALTMKEKIKVLFFKLFPSVYTKIR